MTDIYDYEMEDRSDLIRLQKQKNNLVFELVKLHRRVDTLLKGLFKMNMPLHRRKMQTTLTADV